MRSNHALQRTAAPSIRSTVAGFTTPPFRSCRLAGRLSLSRLVDLMCAGPARVYGVLGKGRLAVGYDADFTLVDMQARRRIEESWIVSPCGWTPFAGMDITGWPIATILRGHAVMRDDEVLGTPLGRLVRFAG